MTADFHLLKGFNFSESIPHLWVFKGSASTSRFRTFYVQTDNELNNELKGFANTEIDRITEHSPYSHISQTNESSCLTISHDDTNFSYLKSKVDRLESEHRVTGGDDLIGAKGYVVKFTHDGTTVYGVKRSTSTWKTTYPRKFINMVFSNGELTGVQDNSFSIEKSFDFYVINDSLFVANKRGFESTMQHRTEYLQAFSQLQQTPQFNALFTDLAPIIEYVGTNSMQLRRMAVIEDKGIYTNPSFMPTLQRVNSERGWGMNFDPETNSITPCADTVKVILQVLLDHRLMSEITDNTYDVPDATQV